MARTSLFNIIARDLSSCVREARLFVAIVRLLTTGAKVSLPAL